MQCIAIEFQPVDFFRFRENIRKAGGIEKFKFKQSRKPDEIRFAALGSGNVTMDNAEETHGADNKPVCMKNFNTPRTAGKPTQRAKSLRKAHDTYIQPYNKSKDFGLQHVPRSLSKALPSGGQLTPGGQPVIIAGESIVQQQQHIQDELETATETLDSIREHLVDFPEGELKKTCITLCNAAVSKVRDLADSAGLGGNGTSSEVEPRKIAILGPNRGGKSFFLNAFLEVTQKDPSQYNPEDQRKSQTNDPKSYIPNALLQRLVDHLADEANFAEDQADYEERREGLEEYITKFDLRRAGPENHGRPYFGKRGCSFTNEQDNRIVFVKPSTEAVNHVTGMINKDGPMKQHLVREAERKQFLQEIKGGSTKSMPKHLDYFFLKSSGKDESETQCNHSIYGGDHWSASIHNMTIDQVIKCFKSQEWSEVPNNSAAFQKLTKLEQKERSRLYRLVVCLVEPLPTPEKYIAFDKDIKERWRDKKVIQTRDGKSIEMKDVASLLKSNPELFTNLELLGRITTIIGVGKNSVADRIFVKTMLAWTTEDPFRGLLIEEIVIVADNYFLTDKTALVDTPGLGDTGAQAYMKMYDAVRDAQSVIVFFTKGMANEEVVVKAITDLELLERVDRPPGGASLESLFFLQMTEARNFRPAVEDPSADSDSILGERVAQEAETMVSNLEDTLLDILVTKCPELSSVTDTQTARRWLDDNRMSMESTRDTFALSAFPLVYTAIQRADDAALIDEKWHKMLKVAGMDAVITKICACLGLLQNQDYEKASRELTALHKKLKEGVDAGVFQHKPRTIPATHIEAAQMGIDANRPNQAPRSWLMKLTKAAELKEAITHMEEAMEMTEGDTEKLESWIDGVADKVCEIISFEKAEQFDAFLCASRTPQMILELQEQIEQFCGDSPALIAKNIFTDRVLAKTFALDMAPLQDILKEMIRRTVTKAEETHLFNLVYRMLEQNLSGGGGAAAHTPEPKQKAARGGSGKKAKSKTKDDVLDETLKSTVEFALRENAVLTDLKSSHTELIVQGEAMRSPNRDKSHKTNIVAMAAKVILRDQIETIIGAGAQGKFTDDGKKCLGSCLLHANVLTKKDDIKKCIRDLILTDLKKQAAQVVRSVAGGRNKSRRWDPVKEIIQDSLKKIVDGNRDDSQTDMRNDKFQSALLSSLTATAQTLNTGSVPVHELSCQAVLDKLRRYRELRGKKDGCAEPICPDAIKANTIPSLNQMLIPGKTKNTWLEADVKPVLGLIKPATATHATFQLERCLAEIVTGSSGTTDTFHDDTFGHFREMILAHLYIMPTLNFIEATKKEYEYREGHKLNGDQNDLSSLPFIESFCLLYNVQVYVVIADKNEDEGTAGLNWFYPCSSKSSKCEGGVIRTAVRWDQTKGFLKYKEPPLEDGTATRRVFGGGGGGGSAEAPTVSGRRRRTSGGGSAGAAAGGGGGSSAASARAGKRTRPVSPARSSSPEPRAGATSSTARDSSSRSPSPWAKGEFRSARAGSGSGWHARGARVNGNGSGGRNDEGPGESAAPSGPSTIASKALKKGEEMTWDYVSSKTKRGPSEPALAVSPSRPLPPKPNGAGMNKAKKKKKRGAPSGWDGTDAQKKAQRRRQDKRRAESEAAAAAAAAAATADAAAADADAAPPPPYCEEEKGGICNDAKMLGGGGGGGKKKPKN